MDCAVGALEELRLDRCHKVTDSAFDIMQSPFHVLAGCLSLRSISLEGCPQITGHIVHSLNGVCRNLRNLNLSQCKQIESAAIQEIFDHDQLTILNLSFISEVSDVAFCKLPMILSDSSPLSPLEILNLGNSKITDESLFRMAYLGALLEIRLQFCSGLTDNGIVALVKHCRQLQCIDLKSCAITSISVEAVAIGCKDLRRLDLSWCGDVNDSGRASLVFVTLALAYIECTIAIALLAAKCTHLDTLCLVWCSQLTDDSMLSLLSLPRLDTVEVQGCFNITEKAVERLRNNRTGVNVVL
jgi:F-box and leucine-rich repeat protein 2/20